jgi:pimeloyl-ACP methyl ester carboxylesterase
MKKHLACKSLISSLLIILVWGCAKDTKVPMDTLHYLNDTGERNRCLFVFLPGVYDDINAFETQGFIKAVRNKKLEVDMVVADAHPGYYKKRNLWVRLREDVILPAKASGYEQIWLIGISMGGLGSLLYTMTYPDEIAGMVLFAPHLGDEEIINKINRGGGIDKWDPGRISGDDWQNRLLLWLKKYRKQKNSFPQIYLGYGKNDEYLATNEMLAKILPPDRVVVINGEHKWTTFRVLWDIVLEKIELEEINCSG